MATQAAPRERQDAPRRGARLAHRAVARELPRAGRPRCTRARTALVHGARRLTYRELDERVDPPDLRAPRAGIERGDRVAVLAPNTPAMVEAHFAVPAAGAVLVCINTRQSPREVARLLEHAGPQVVLVDAEYEALLSSFDTSAVEVIRDRRHRRARRPLRAAPGVRLARALPGRAAATRRTPSRSTTPRARPATRRAWIYTHRGAYLNALANVIEAGLTPRSRLLLVAPLFHCNGWCFAVGRGGRRGDDRLPAPGRPRRDVAVDRRGGRHPLQQRAHGPDRAGQRTPPRTGCPPGSPPCTGGSPPSPTLLGRLARAEHHARTTSTA